MDSTLSFPLELGQQLPEVVGNVDYQVFRKLLERMEEILASSQIERPFMHHVIASHSHEGKTLSSTFQFKLARRACVAFRCNLLLRLTKLSFRALSTRLADSPLLQRFCLLQRLDKVQVPSKSQLERYEKLFPADLIQEAISELNTLAAIDSHTVHPLDLKNAVDVDAVYIDATCVEAHIHLPVDWVLLRDATITLMKAVAQVRQAGLCHRMSEPSTFVTAMNKLSVKMTHARRKKTQKKVRKAILRDMKKLVKKVAQHALRHQSLLAQKWQESILSLAQTQQLFSKFDRILEQLPQAIHQAHERIIGERKVASKDKILSLYEADIHICVRGKTHKETEFGNTLLIAEQQQGLILDWHFYKEKAPGETRLFKASIKRLKQKYPIESAAADRGMDSGENSRFLRKEGIDNYICPKSPQWLCERLKENDFQRHQKRRAQTEGRIGILKHQFIHAPLRSKGFEHRHNAVAWAILTHNLWVLARLEKRQSELISKVA